MRTKTLLGICSVALLLAGWGAPSGALAQDEDQTRVRKESKGMERGADQRAEGQPRHFFANSLGSGIAIDVYRIQCSGACTSCQADVRDIGPFNDTNFKVCVIGSGPGATGTTCRISPQGGLSALAVVTRAPAGPFLSFVTISEANNAGFENYDSAQHCSGFGGTHSIVRILNQ